MKRTIGACIIVAALCAAGLSGCGGSAEEPAAADGDATTGDATTGDSDSGDFVARAEALCRYLAVRFAVDLRTALSDTDQIAMAADTADPTALAPTFAAAEAGFGRAVGLIEVLQADFDELDAVATPEGALEALALVDQSLATLHAMLVDVQEAAAAQDQEAFAATLGRLRDLEQAQLDEAARQLAAVGATDCLPAA